MKRRYDKKESIPEGLEKLYTEKDGAYILNDIEGLKPVEEFQELNKQIRELEKYKKDSETKFSALKDHDPKEILTKLDELEALKLKGKDGKLLDGEEFNKALAIKTAELKREIDALKSENSTLSESHTALKGEKIRNLLKEKIHNEVYDKEKKDYRVHPWALEDIEIRMERDLEFDESRNDFFTKDDKKLPLSDYLKQVKQGKGWEKGNTGSHDSGGSHRNPGEEIEPQNSTARSIEDAIKRNKV